MQESCTSQSWTAGFCGGEGKESHPLHHTHIEQEDMQSRLFLINPLAKFSFSRILFPGSTDDLPGPRYLSGAHHHSHHAISSPSPQDIMFLLLFSLPLSPPTTIPKSACLQVLRSIQGAAGVSSPSCKAPHRAQSLSSAQEHFCKYRRPSVPLLIHTALSEGQNHNNANSGHHKKKQKPSLRSPSLSRQFQITSF